MPTDEDDADATNTHGKTDKKDKDKPQTDAIPEDDSVLQDAIEAAKNAKSSAELTQVWKDFKPKFENVPAFVNAVKANPNHPSNKQK